MSTEPQAIIVRHIKTGGLYEVMGPAILESTGQELTVYRSLKDGKVWARPTAQFSDGRFELEKHGAAPAQEADKP